VHAANANKALNRRQPVAGLATCEANLSFFSNAFCDETLVGGDVGATLRARIWTSIDV
jgi:hypothetical protein